jgi:NADPH-dependent glutamate synthase beta subunit-like oxidoreductase/NAD(P)H-flavin reductase
MLSLGIDGFSYHDLHNAPALARLHERFLKELKLAAPALAAEFDAHRAGTVKLTAPQESELLIRVAEHVSRFVGKLFGVDKELAALSVRLTEDLKLFEFKREFVSRKVFKKGATERPTADELPVLEERMRLLFKLGFGWSGTPQDEERAVAESVLTLMHIEKQLAGGFTPPQPEHELTWAKLQTALLSTPEGKATFASTLVPGGVEAARGLLSLADRWTYARAKYTHLFHGWSTIAQPQPLVFDKLVELKTPDPAMPEMVEGPPEHMRRRDGFKLTDPRASQREVMDQIDYCIICHERERDSCSKGFKEKDTTKEHTYKPNPMGIPLTGCPLEEKVSEAHLLKSRGDSLAALAVIMIDNPMCPGTGHRICNDCMKACIFQKQDPVNIPQIETSALTDVLALPYGFEIYGLLTRWNPLNLKRPYALPYNGKNVMVVGLGPAGYTLGHYLLNEGFAVAGIDGLKVEPFDDSLTGKNGAKLQPLKDFKQLSVALDQRVLAGFGGVSEYGITVRWDKTFLTLIHLTLARREHLMMYGGIRFGGTLTIEDAWGLGFDHIAIAAGAGSPTLLNIKNNLLRGMRAASDFLMALQLTGAAKKDSLANLQVQLPALVIGGGLTGIDTATELFAYYPVQVEKVLGRHEKLVAELGEEKVLAKLDPEEKATYLTFLEHGRAIRAERARAAKVDEKPNFIPLVRAWGGVSLCYRRSLIESPAYRLNHEEVAEALEEGIRIIERVAPVEAVPDELGAVKAMKFERMSTVDGKLKGTGTYYELPAKTVCVAAGTKPNVTYEREYPNTFLLDNERSFFRGYDLVDGPEGWQLHEVHQHEDIGKDTGFFTSYSKDQKFITFYGDNHPTYAGNVVKAMASAKDGYPQVSKLFAKEIAAAPDAVRSSAELFKRLDDAFIATVVAVNRLTATIVEVVVRAPFAAKHFHPGQFYRLQNFERRVPRLEETTLAMEGLALTGAWVDKEKGLMSTIVLEMGGSSRLCAALKPGEPVVLMGPTGTPTEIPQNETVLLVGGGLGNAVLFSIGQALEAAGCAVIYFAGYRTKEDSYKMDDVEKGTDQVIWSVDSGELIKPRREQDQTFRGNVVQAMVAYAKGELGRQIVPLRTVDRLIVIGSDRMMKAVKDARHGVLQPYLKPLHTAVGSINSPMQCMMKEICAQCLQRHVDPKTGKESFVFSCFNQDQHLDDVDFVHLNARLRANTVLEKQSNLWLDHLIKKSPGLIRI